MRIGTDSRGLDVRNGVLGIRVIRRRSSVVALLVFKKELDSAVLE